MKKIQKPQANGFYIFTGRSNANSCFIEKLSDAKQFIIYANYFLKGYLKVYEYMINKDGWIMIVKVESKNKIFEKAEFETDEIWRIISERVRLFLCTFVKVTNNRKGRTGSLVHSVYERYYFESLAEALSYLDKVRNQQIKMYSRKKKYMALKTHYKISNKLGKGSVFLCSKEVFSDKMRGREFGEMLVDKRLSNLVALKMVDFTKIIHSIPFDQSTTLKQVLKPRISPF